MDTAVIMFSVFKNYICNVQCSSCRCFCLDIRFNPELEEGKFDPPCLVIVVNSFVVVHFCFIRFVQLFYFVREFGARDITLLAIVCV